MPRLLMLSTPLTFTVLYSKIETGLGKNRNSQSHVLWNKLCLPWIIHSMYWIQPYVFVLNGNQQVPYKAHQYQTNFMMDTLIFTIDFLKAFVCHSVVICIFLWVSSFSPAHGDVIDWNFQELVWWWWLVTMGVEHAVSSSLLFLPLPLPSFIILIVFVKYYLFIIVHILSHGSPAKTQSNRWYLHKDTIYTSAKLLTLKYFHHSALGTCIFRANKSTAKTVIQRAI